MQESFSVPQSVCPLARKKRSRSGRVPEWFHLPVPGKADAALCRGRSQFLSLYWDTIGKCVFINSGNIF